MADAEAFNGSTRRWVHSLTMSTKRTLTASQPRSVDAPRGSLNVDDGLDKTPDAHNPNDHGVTGI
ncbi:MAG TPA: hypothetical protein VIP75_02955, partial [Acidothermales bacterium]